MLSAIKGALVRGLWRCSAWATSSLPVPDSPSINTLIDERDNRPMMRNTSCIAGASPMISVVGAADRLITWLLLLLIVADSTLDQRNRFIDIERLRQVIKGTLLIGADGSVQNLNAPSL